MTRNVAAASVAENKERNPGKYCPVKRCLWRTGGGYCPRHQHLAQGDRQDAAAGKPEANAILQALRNLTAVSECWCSPRGVTRQCYRCDALKAIEDFERGAAGKDYSEEFTPSEAEAIHRAIVREEQGRQSEERGE